MTTTTTTEAPPVRLVRTGQPDHVRVLHEPDAHGSYATLCGRAVKGTPDLGPPESVTCAACGRRLRTTRQYLPECYRGEYPTLQDRLAASPEFVRFLEAEDRYYTAVQAAQAARGEREKAAAKLNDAGWSYRQIAEAADLTHPRVQQLVTRGRSLLVNEAAG